MGVTEMSEQDSTRRPGTCISTAAVVAVLVLSLPFIPATRGDECGTRFTDAVSSAVRAQVIIQGSVREFNPTLQSTGMQSANVTVRKVLKGEHMMANSREGEDEPVVVMPFGHEDKENCVVSPSAMTADSEYIFFLRSSTQQRELQMSALPVHLDAQMQRRVRSALCDTCVRPPQIKRITCRDCARAPKIKEMTSKKVKMGRKAKLRCLARGKPTPTFSWFKGEVPISSGSGSITILTTATMSTLLFTKTSSAHGGRYKCLASNDAGSSEGTVTLEVTRSSAPQYTVETAPDRVECQNNPCLNSGTCYYSASLDLRICVCSEKFDGVRCEVLRDSHGNLSSSSSAPRGRTESMKTTPKKVKYQVNGGSNSSETVPASSLGLNNSSRGPAPRRLLPSYAQLRNQKESATDMESSKNSSSVSEAVSDRSLANQMNKLPTSSTTLDDNIRSKKANGREIDDGQSLDKTELERISKTHLKIVTCREKTYCLNRGRCKFIKKLNKKFCRCPSGYSGARCEHVTLG